MESDDIKNLENKTESDLTTPHILIKHLKPLHIVTASLKKTEPNTTFVLPPHFDTSIQTQLISDLDASVGANDVASARLYKINNHHGNIDYKDNDDSQSYETPWGKFRSSYFGYTISTTTTLRSSTLTLPGK